MFSISVVTSLKVFPKVPGVDCFFNRNDLMLTKCSWHLTDLRYLSSLLMSTPKLPTGDWMFDLIVDPKCFRISFSVLHPVVIYLKKDNYVTNIFYSIKPKFPSFGQIVSVLFPMFYHVK